MQPAISIQNLSKQYKLATTNSYVALRDVLTNAAKNFFRSPKDKASSFWALQDIDLEIGEGERIGIIGHNGAGKSTLLKIISRITPPTKGKVTLNGRVASLLEVGTGFHPELTGRENIYLNGSILGLKKKEIDRRLDEIIDFSGVEKFIDAPLKQYSSGMQLRLAFSVAAHLEAEILLIDEVLAVGDIEFQKKCIGKMEEISKEKGRTILFVSHDIHAINSLTERAILLIKGRLSSFDKTNVVIQKYLLDSKQESVYKSPQNGTEPYFKHLKLTTSNDNGFQNFGECLSINIILHLPKPVDVLEFSFQICSKETSDSVIYNWFSTSNDLKYLIGKKGDIEISICIPSLRLYKGHYFFKFYLSDPRGKEVYQVIERILPFQVEMHNIQNEWGWQEKVCKYIEQYNINFPSK